MLAIEIENLTKRFDRKYAVKNLDMHVEEGTIYGFIGQNGAGKSTTQKLICGLLQPNEGSIKLYGKSNEDSAIRREMGLLIESPALFPYSTAYENMVLQAYNLGIGNPRAQITACLEKVGLGKTGGKKVKDFSLGMKQRLAIAVSLLGRPSLLVLDEPINGLDPNGIIEIRNTLLKLNREEHITILISSHILGELSRIATHYGIIKGGSMIKEISAEELSRQCEDFIRIKASPIDRAVQVLRERLDQAQVMESDMDECKLYGMLDGREVNRLLMDEGIVAEEISYHRMDLEEYFLKLMGGENV